MNRDLVSYYKERAKEYERVYLNPDEQEDLGAATALFQNIFAGKSVLEIACGTGYWTKQIALTANAIFATDINASVVEIAKAKQLGNHVTFQVADLFKLPPDKKYEGLFAGFIWSHILLQDMDRFLDSVGKLITPGGDIVFIDSNPVENTSHDKKRITRTDQYGNTYQTRTLDNGTTHEVLKNFPTQKFLVQKLSRIATDINFVNLKYYWIVTCRLKEPEK